MFVFWTYMPDTKRVVVFYEGDDDKAFLEELRASRHLPENWDLANRSKNQHPGKDGLIRQLLPLVRPLNGAGGSAVVLIDLDELTFDQRAGWFRSQLDQALRAGPSGVQLQDGPAANERVRSYHLKAEDKVGRLALVPVGLPGHELLMTTYKVDRFAIDDWLLQLVLHEKVYSAVTDFRAVPFGTARAKLIEVAELFRKNGLEVRKSKTYVQILRALAGIAPSTATMVGRLVKKGAETLTPQEFRALVHPLLDDLEAASRLLTAE
jgi:hypothetical protein